MLPFQSAPSLSLSLSGLDSRSKAWLFWEFLFFVFLDLPCVCKFLSNCHTELVGLRQKFWTSYAGVTVVLGQSAVGWVGSACLTAWPFPLCNCSKPKRLLCKICAWVLETSHWKRVRDCSLSHHCGSFPIVISLLVFSSTLYTLLCIPATNFGQILSTHTLAEWMPSSLHFFSYN